jgi:hypothetical protein
MKDEYICRAAPPDVVKYIKELRQQIERKNKVIQKLAELGQCVYLYNKNCIGSCKKHIIKYAEQSLDSGE